MSTPKIIIKSQACTYKTSYTIICKNDEMRLYSEIWLPSSKTHYSLIIFFAYDCVCYR